MCLGKRNIGVLAKIVLIIPFLVRPQELCESRGGRPGILVPNSLYGLCGRKGTLNLNMNCIFGLFSAMIVDGGGTYGHSFLLLGKHTHTHTHTPVSYTHLTLPTKVNVYISVVAV